MLPKKGCHGLSLHSVTCRLVTVIFITVTVMGLVTVDVSLASQDERKVVTGRREKRHVRINGQDRAAPTNDQLYRLLQEYDNNQGSTDLLLYTPTTPSPEHVNCHVEIPVTRRVGGKCLNFGSFVGCQAGIYLAFDSMCEEQLGLSQNDATRSSQSLLNRSRRRNPFQSRRRNNSQRLRSRP